MVRGKVWQINKKKKKKKNYRYKNANKPLIRNFVIAKYGIGICLSNEVLKTVYLYVFNLRSSELSSTQYLSCVFENLLILSNVRKLS